MTKRNVEEYFYKPPTRRAKEPGEERKSCADFNQILDVKTTEEHGCYTDAIAGDSQGPICKTAVSCMHKLQGSDLELSEPLPASGDVLKGGELAQAECGRSSAVHASSLVEDGSPLR